VTFLLGKVVDFKLFLSDYIFDYKVDVLGGLALMPILLEYFD